MCYNSEDDYHEGSPVQYISYTNDTNIYFVTETQEFRYFRSVISERVIQNILHLFYYTYLQDISEGLYHAESKAFT